MLRLSKLGESMIECIIFGHTCSIEKELAPMWFCFQIDWLIKMLKNVLRFNLI
jgi:hypothetical protein